MRKAWPWLGLVVALAAGWFFFVHKPWRPHGPLAVSFWYWNTPYQIAPSDLVNLRKAGVKQMFVRAGTFTGDGQNLILRFPQDYRSGPKNLPIHLVFNADGGVVRHFESYEVAKVGPQIASRLISQVAEAEKAGLKVAGVQLDFDCPTRLLPRYADLIRLIRRSDSRLKRGGLQFSVSGLWSWLGTQGVERLSGEVDFMVPQAYEMEIGLSPDTVLPVSNPAELKKRLPLAESLRCPYWIGVPAYGHAFLFDDQNRLIDIFREFEVQDAFRHPALQAGDAYPVDQYGKPAKLESESVGEGLAHFTAVEAGRDGRGKGFHIVYTVPEPGMLANAISQIESGAGAGCQGYVVYRLDRPGSSGSLGMETDTKIIQKQSVSPAIKVQVEQRTAFFNSVESGSGKAPLDLYVTAENVGDAATFAAPDGLTVKLTFAQSGVDDINLRGFDSIRFQALDGSQVTAGRASQIVLLKGYLAPGEKCEAGPIRLAFSDLKNAKITWQARLPDGFKTISGAVEPDALVRNR